MHHYCSLICVHFTSPLPITWNIVCMGIRGHNVVSNGKTTFLQCQELRPGFWVCHLSRLLCSLFSYNNWWSPISPPPSDLNVTISMSRWGYVLRLHATNKGLSHSNVAERRGDFASCDRCWLGRLTRSNSGGLSRSAYCPWNANWRTWLCRCSIRLNSGTSSACENQTSSLRG